MQKGPILFVDDDDEDLDIVKEVITQLNLDRPAAYFKSGAELIQYLRTSITPPFLIVSDVNLLGETGFSVRRQIADDKELRYKSVPFIFWSTAASEKQIQEAYDLPAQGFFFKPSNITDLKDTLETIIKYWSKSQHPKKVQ